MSQSNLPNWAEVQPAGGERHLPVYLLIDTSDSMKGAPIEAVRQGLEQFQTETAGDEYARSIVHVGVITFGSEAKLVTEGLVPITSFQPPILEAAGATRLDLAFQELQASMDAHVVKPIKGAQKGDWKPCVFIFTDGLPTDSNGTLTNELWKPARDGVLNRVKGETKPSEVIAFGCGPNVVNENLKDISTGVAFRMGSSVASFVAVLRYVSMSLAASVASGANPDNTLLSNLDKVSLPPDLIRIP